jgi:pyruvate dehydrogenase E2 component (dihydrolipoamide acetyltransferase)
LTTKEISVPNIGGATNVEVIEIMVTPGAKVKKEDSLITLESDKASMEIPSPYEGIVDTVKLKIGDKVSEGSPILTLKIAEAASVEKAEPKTTAPPPSGAPQAKAEQKVSVVQPAETTPKVAAERKEQKEIIAAEVHAGPAVRRLARELGVDLSEVQASGPKHRILKEDLQTYVKTALSQAQTGAGLAIPAMPAVDFAKFGEIEQQPLNRIKKLTGVHVHRSWVTIPHVTQFGEADITHLDEFRKSQKSIAEKEGVKLTPLVFIMKAVVAALKAFPHFNASLDSAGENLILKKYFHLGIAVDTPNGLVVPVIRDVDKKGMFELARELANISRKAREKGLSPIDMSGSSFTISSLGGIGGTAFTPIVNAPDVAILGVSKAAIKPVYQTNQFVPRLMLPLALSYDHRVVDGADGARFMEFLTSRLADIRTLLL